MFQIRAIIPTTPLLDTETLMRAVNEGLDEAAREVNEVDFAATYDTWTHKPQFTVEKNGLTREIGTDDEIYSYVSNGTPPHTIVPRNAKNLRFTRPFAPKTQKNVIGSYEGNRGDEGVYAKSVNSPGISAREFDSTIARSWDEDGKLQQAIQNAIDRMIED